MNRRQFLALGPAFPAATVSASLIVKEDGKEALELGVNVLRLQPGDALVLRCKGRISYEQQERIAAVIKNQFPGMKAFVLDSDITLEGVLRGDGTA